MVSSSWNSVMSYGFWICNIRRNEMLYRKIQEDEQTHKIYKDITIVII